VNGGGGGAGDDVDDDDNDDDDEDDNDDDTSVDGSEVDDDDADDEWVVGCEVWRRSSACVRSFPLSWRVLSIIFVSSWVSSSSTSISSLSDCSGSCGGGGFGAFFFFFSQGVGCGARTFFASQSFANCLKSMVAASMMRDFVLVVDPFSLRILSAWACIGSPEYDESIQSQASSTMFCQFAFVYVVLLRPPESSCIRSE
jgi:hypothetical protein